MQRIREQKYRKCTQDAYSCQVSFSVSETGQVTMAVIGLLCWIAGILLEAYVNPMILKYLLL